MSDEFAEFDDAMAKCKEKENMVKKCANGCKEKFSVKEERKNCFRSKCMPLRYKARACARKAFAIIEPLMVFK
ncbi:hypothetical protein Q1695_003591 [Nippostrongylus brasiliensis]|nr:hypothetical protein Q1695_003591 [Nippostrongylus brasiliensis]